MPQASFKKDLVKVFLLALPSLFLVPLAGFLFVQYAEPQLDADYFAAIERMIDKDGRLSEQDRQAGKAFLRAHPASSTCQDASPEVSKYRANVCAPYSELWQFHAAGRISFWTLVAGLAVVFAVLLLGAVAFVNRGAQYFSFVLGWRLLTLASALEVIVQGALLVWLSFWVTAFFFHVYYLKLILLAGLCAALAVFYAVVCIFKRPPQSTGIEGELVSAGDAPALWARLRDCAARLKTAPPDHVVAGIDTNFFVTEAPLTVGGRALMGRSLFVSLPLLRVLDRSEADAVLAHELAHLRGGDTASSAALGPKLVQYDQYCQMMRSNAVTIFVFYLMRMYRVIFEIALQRDSRAREFLADRTAATLVSAKAIVHALIKIAAYATYRAETERKLFEHDRQHGGSLGIAQHIASGLAPYASSARFVDAMRSASIPHPFDSHPALPERMKNVGHHLDARHYGLVVTSTPAETWVSDIRPAAQIEQRLWAAYEQHFAAAHEQSLAYRYEPANDAERAIVLKHFPPIVFQLRRDKEIQVTYAGLVPPGQGELLSWDQVRGIKYTDGFGGDVLEIEHPEKGWLGAKRTKVKLPGIRKERARFKAILGHYWKRHQIMRHETAARAGGQAGDEPLAPAAGTAN